MNRQKNRLAEPSERQSSAVSFRQRLERIDLFYLNLAWMILLGVALLWWIGSFTNYLETVIGFLSLGGIFAWVAFLSNIIREQRKKHLRLVFEGCLKRKRSSMILGALTGLGLIFAFCIGGITADSGRDKMDREIVIHLTSSKTVARTKTLSSRMRSKFPVFTGFRGRKYDIDVEGLPLITKEIQPFSQFHLKVPRDLRLQNVILLRPSVQLAGSVDNSGDYTLEVRLNDQDPNEMDFSGHSVWIGTGKKLDIPAAIKDRWRAELEYASGAPVSTLLSWLDPEVFEKIPVLKKDVKRIEVKVWHSNNRDKPFALAPPESVRDCESEEDFPQVIHIKTKQEQ
jgi:hypothetical protein